MVGEFEVMKRISGKRVRKYTSDVHNVMMCDNKQPLLNTTLVKPSDLNIFMYTSKKKNDARV